MRKAVSDGTTVTETDYLDGFQYEKVDAGDVELKFFPHAEGYVNNTVIDDVNVYNYVYNYTDHLGNIRMSYTWDSENNVPKIMQENHYYPFGFKHAKYNASTWDYVKDETGDYTFGVVLKPDTELGNKYKYNGKEYQDELGLNMYDYGMMLYDPAIGRRNNIDPLAEKIRRWSPYTYALNNPVYFIDPDGMSAINHLQPNEPKVSSWWEEYMNSKPKDASQGWATGGPIDPPKPGTGTSTGNRQGTIPAGQPGAGLPNGVDTPTETLQEVVVRGKPKSSGGGYFDGYFEAYRKWGNGKENPYSPYTPDALGFTVNAHVNTGMFAEFNVQGGFAADSRNNVALFGGYGGNFGWNSTFGIPSVGFGITCDMHDNYGNNTDVLGGPGGTNKSYWGAAGPLNGSYSKSARPTMNGYIWEDNGVETKSIGVGFGLGGGMGISNGGVIKLGGN